MPAQNKRKGGTVRKLAKADLQRSDITWDEAEAAGIEYVSDASEIYDDFHALPALLLPYADPWSDDWIAFERDGLMLPFCRVRYLIEPPVPKGFKNRKPQRYGQPRNSGVQPYFPVVDHFDWREVLADPSVPIVVTEGEKKALRGSLAGYPTIGLGGVHNFMKDGELVPFLNRVSWRGRKVFLNYDSDAAANPHIQAAEGRLATELSTKRKANVFLVRLPDAEDGGKQGIDDFIVNHGGGEDGEKAWEQELRAAIQIRKSDAMVLDMNKSVCIIAKDEALYEFRTRQFMTKTHFKEGSTYASVSYETPAKKGNGLVKHYVAPQYLKHEHALRYDDIIFDPSTEEKVVELDGKICLNTWDGLEGTPGDVRPFLELTQHISKSLAADQRDFLLKLMAYKLQNPARKIPIAPVLVGDAGSGKSMWARIIREACGAYGHALLDSQLRSDFNGWIEKSIIAVLDEAQGDTVRQKRDYIKTLISEERLPLNEKYRKARSVFTPTMYILTSNDRRAAAYEFDDRRMFVVDVRGHMSKDWYRATAQWINAGGPSHVLHYLQTYDLKGWTPPNHAPLTAEKMQAYQESLTPVQQMAETMKTADENIVLMWCDAAMAWAQEHDGSSNAHLSSQASEVRAALRHMPIRPIYTPEELAKILPHLAWTLSGQKLSATPSGELSRQLRSAGIRYLIPADDSRGFLYRGMYKQFLVVANHDEVPETMSQNKFERIIKSARSYGSIRGIG